MRTRDKISKSTFVWAFGAILCLGSGGGGFSEPAARAPQDDVSAEELKDPIEILDDEDRTLGTLPAERVWLPHISDRRGDAKLGVTRAGHVYVAMGRTLCWSEDEGRTWKNRPLPERSWGFGVLRDDTLVLFTGYSSYTPRKAEPFPHCGVVRSTDLGKTWAPPFFLDLAPYNRCGAGWTHIHQLPDGTALMTVALHYGTARMDLETLAPLPDEKYGLFDHIYRSRDSGKTWGDKSLIVRDAAETTLLGLRSGKLMAAIRYQRFARLLPEDDIAQLKEIGAWEDGAPAFKHAFFAKSDDQGYTWKNLRLAPVTPAVKQGLVPSEFVQLPDGRLVWVYLQRTGEITGLYARVSSDEGRTWSAERYRLRRLRDKREGTYPASTLLRDGAILTISSKNGGNQPMAIRWRLPAE